MKNKEFGELYELTSSCILEIIDPLAGIDEKKLREIAERLSFKTSSASKSAGEIIFAVLRSYHKFKQYVNNNGVPNENKDLKNDDIPGNIRKRLENIE